MQSVTTGRTSPSWQLRGIACAALLACGTFALAQPLPAQPVPLGQPSPQGQQAQTGQGGQPAQGGQPGVPGQPPGAALLPPPPPQAWRIEPYFGATVTATDNSGLSTAAQIPKDVIIDLTPRLVVRGRGAGFTVDTDVTLRALAYTDDTQDNRILPVGSAALNARLIDRWLYLDTSLTADQINADPYAFRTDIDTGRNKINTLTYRLSPYLKHDFSPSLSLLARSDNYWTHRRAEFSDIDPRRDTRVERHTVSLDKRPLPLGFNVEAVQEMTTYRTGVQDTLLELASARGVITYAIDPTFVVGLVGGAEKIDFALTSTTDQIAGARFTWLPTERSEIKGSYEKRFFGNGGSLEIRHRSPFVGISLSASREPSAVGSSFVLRPELGSVPALLDAVYTTRYPDPVTRAAIVNSVINGLGLPNELGEPLEVFSSYAQLRDSLTASVLFQGLRSTFIARIYSIKLQPLNLVDTPIVPTLPLISDNQQRGVSFEFTRRLTFNLTGNVSLGHATIKGLGGATGQSTTNTLVRVSATRDLSPNTKVNAGVRYVRDKFVLPTGSGEADERAAFVGFIHRF